jgi:protein FAM161A
MVEEQEQVLPVPQMERICVSNNVLWDEVDELKIKHQDTLAFLERLKQNQKALREATNELLESAISYRTTDTISPITCDDTDSNRLEVTLQESSDVELSYNNSTPPCESSDYSNIIEHMWDGFTVEEYAPSKLCTTRNEAVPRFTIPQPFSMTLREERKKKKKSRTLQQAEKEKLERQAQEEAELHKRFKANPVPATTSLPLYEMINAFNEQRREDIKANSKAILKATEKPFSFAAREKAKEMKALQAMERLRDVEDSRQTKKSRFYAKPVPQGLFDPMIDEKIKEEELYRQIRIKARALETLAKSHLPTSMQTQGRHYTIGRLRKEMKEEMETQAFLTCDHKFHPLINKDVPDHQYAYHKFHTETQIPKKSSTIIEPFDLCTDRRMNVRQLKENKRSTSKGSLKSSKSNDDMKRRVLEKSTENDLSSWLEERKQINLEMLRKNDINNKLEYEQQLKEIYERVKDRPLLFEQQ